MHDCDRVPHHHALSAAAPARASRAEPWTENRYAPPVLSAGEAEPVVLPVGVAPAPEAGAVASALELSVGLAAADALAVVEAAAEEEAEAEASVKVAVRNTISVPVRVISVVSDPMNASHAISCFWVLWSQPKLSEKEPSLMEASYRVESRME